MAKSFHSPVGLRTYTAQFARKVVGLIPKMREKRLTVDLEASGL